MPLFTLDTPDKLQYHYITLTGVVKGQLVLTQGAVHNH